MRLLQGIWCSNQSPQKRDPVARLEVSRFLKNATPIPAKKWLLPKPDSESGPCNSDSGNRLTSRLDLFALITNS